MLTIEIAGLAVIAAVIAAVLAWAVIDARRDLADSRDPYYADAPVTFLVNPYGQPRRRCTRCGLYDHRALVAFATAEQLAAHGPPPPPGTSPAAYLAAPTERIITWP